MRGRYAYRLVLIVICSAIVSIPPLAGAQQARDKEAMQKKMQSAMRGVRGQQRWWQDESKADQIGLSDEQIQQLDQMADRGRENIRPVRQQYFRAYRSLIETLNEDADNAEAIGAARAEFLAAWSDVTAVGADQLIEMRSILTHEQWSQLPEVAPRALRIGNVALRGSGVANPGASKGSEN
jgi:Spy/CpxP family protein refolding chaperone